MVEVTTTSVWLCRLLPHDLKQSRRALLETMVSSELAPTIAIDRSVAAQDGTRGTDVCPQLRTLRTSQHFVAIHGS